MRLFWQFGACMYVPCGEGATKSNTATLFPNEAAMGGQTQHQTQNVTTDAHRHSCYDLHKGKMQDKKASVFTLPSLEQASPPDPPPITMRSQSQLPPPVMCRHVQIACVTCTSMQAHRPNIHEACKFHGFRAVLQLLEIPLHTTVLCRESNSNSLVTHVSWLQSQGVSVWYFLRIHYFWTWHIMALAFVILLNHGIRVHMYPFKLSDALLLSAKLLLVSKSCDLARKSPFVQK